MTLPKKFALAAPWKPQRPEFIDENGAEIQAYARADIRGEERPRREFRRCSQEHTRPVGRASNFSSTAMGNEGIGVFRFQ
jgi:hypothetical protein